MEEPQLTPCIINEKYCTILFECNVCLNLSESYIDFQNVLCVYASPGVYINNKGQIHKTIMCCAYCENYCAVNFEQK